AGPHSWTFLSGPSRGVGGGIPVGRLSGAAPRLALPLLCRRCSGFPAGARGAVPERAGARAVRLCTRSSVATGGTLRLDACLLEGIDRQLLQTLVRHPRAQSRVSDGNARHGRDDLLSWR